MLGLNVHSFEAAYAATMSMAWSDVLGPAESGRRKGPLCPNETCVADEPDRLEAADARAMDEAQFAQS